MASQVRGGEAEASNSIGIDGPLPKPPALDDQIRPSSGISESCHLWPEPACSDRQVKVARRLPFDDGLRANNVVPECELSPLDLGSELLEQKRNTRSLFADVGGDQHVNSLTPTARG
jgi:hypothetical protein